MSNKVSNFEPVKRGRGRPSMGGVEMLTVSVTPGTTARIDAVAGPNKRSEFVREAIEEMIKRRQRQSGA